ncbi:hypothetical protein IGI04_021504 [Brassica rapa subsp. trilocularis]|nr:hypothetical protein IGI04_021504 [Brassica rapa subsp. trilocularis]
MVTKGMRVGKYELGRTLGEGNSAKVKLATDTVSGQSFAVKIIDKSSIKRLNVSFQIKREIRTLKVLKHPNIVRLHEVLASKTKIYMVLECVTGGDLFDRVEDGLLHTTCGSPNYVAPEVLANKGYDGAASDIWSCGVILYVILTGCLPFDDANLAVLCRNIFKGDPPIPRWLSPGAKTMIKRMLDPNPITRITIAGIKANDWFNHDYTPSSSDDENDACSFQEDVSEEEKSPDSPTVINAFELIGMSSFLDLSGLFETEKVLDRQIRFTSNRLAIDVLEKIKTTLMEMGFSVQKKHTMLKAIQQESSRKGQSGLSLTAEVFEIIPLLNVVELRKTHVVRQIIKRIKHIISCSKALKGSQEQETNVKLFQICIRNDRGFMYINYFKNGMRVGKYELGRTLGEGNSAKVKLATDTVSGQSFAVKIIDKSSIKRLNVSFQIKREIRTLKVLKHPNIVRLHELHEPDLRGRIWRVDPKLSSVLFLRSTAVKSFPAKRRGGSGSVWADGGLISRRWAVGGGGGEWRRVGCGGRSRSLQALAPYRRIRPDLVAFFPDGVPLLRLVEFHLFLASPVSFPSADAPFSGVFLPWCSGLGDKPQSTWHLFGGRFRRVSFGGGCHYFCLARPLGFLGSSRFSNPVMRLEDGLLHTTCGSPNYVAPEVLANKGYDGAASDIWSCGVILYVILTGCLPFDDANLAVLFRNIFKGDPPIPRWLSPGAKTMIKRMLDPNPITRITIAGIKANDWFNHDYTPSSSDDENDACSFQEDVSEEEKSPDFPTVINAFELIGMSSFLDLSGLFETEKVSDRQIRFTSNRLAIDVLEKIKTTLMEMGFFVQRKHTMLKAIQQESNGKGQSGLSLTAEVFGIVPLLNVVELRKTHVVRQIIKRTKHIISCSKALKGSQEQETNVKLFQIWIRIVRGFMYINYMLSCIKLVH